MDNLDMETSSDSEEEMIASLIDDDDDDDGVRYSLRTRTISKADSRKIDASAVTAAAVETSRNSDGINTSTTADVMNPAGGSQVTGADVQGRLRHSQITFNAVAGVGRHDVEDGGEERRRQMLTTSATSLFELTSARGWMTDQRIRAPEQRVMDERMAYTDARRTRALEGLGIPCVTSAFTVWMTPREQPRIELDVNARPRMSGEDSPTWLEYQRRHADELDEGRRAIARIATLAADSGDELYISTGLRPLLAGGQEPHAVRMDPKTRMCDNATATGISRRGATGQTSKAAGRGGDEFYKCSRIYQISEFREL